MDQQDDKAAARESALHFAVEKGYLDEIVTLLDEGVNVNCTVDTLKRSPLHIASSKGSMPAVKLLTARGADIDARDYELDSALMSAAYLDKLDVCRYLISLGADPTKMNKKKCSALSHYGKSVYCLNPLDAKQWASRRAALLDAHAQRARDASFNLLKPLLMLTHPRAFAVDVDAFPEHSLRTLFLQIMTVSLVAPELSSFAFSRLRTATKVQLRRAAATRLFGHSDVVRYISAFL